MATEFVTLRDGSGLADQLLPPGQNTIQLDHTEALADTGRSFLVPTEQCPDIIEPDSHLDNLKHPLYSRYVRLPKGLLPARKAHVLQEVHEGLATEDTVRFLFASGWAAAEAAIVLKGQGGSRRMELVEGAANTWVRAHDRAQAVRVADKETDDHFCLKERIELALATIPILEGIVIGNVQAKALRCAVDDFLSIGTQNEKLAHGNSKRATFHKGLSYEILALLGLNEEVSSKRFAIPATARNDSGYHLPKLTHDLMIVRQRSGQIKSMLPAEVKSRMSKYDKKRYKALIIDGNAMDILGAGEPGPMIELLAKVYRGDANEIEIATASTMTRQLWAMAAQYSAGSTLRTGTGESGIQFHDASKVKLGGYALYAAAA